VKAFTSETEKARSEAMERMKTKALALGAKAIIGVDIETSDLGLGACIVLISATGTAVILEPAQ
ncbi:MAG: heavy metal-binding domain-containing protein, partial [Candidatus Bathyarchaeia archaeon]